MNIGSIETRDCRDYASKVSALFRFRNAGRKPKDTDEAIRMVQEYNKDILSFKDVYGYSIRGLVPTIADCMM